MGYIYKEITSGNDEATFFKLFWNTLMIDSGGRIVYAGNNFEDDVDTIIGNNQEGTENSFYFNVFCNSLQSQPQIQLQIYRYKNHNNELQTYYIKTMDLTRPMYCCVTTEYPQTQTTRTLKYMMFTNSQTFLLKIGNSDSDLLSTDASPAIQTILLKEGSSTYCAKAYDTDNIMDQDFYVAPYAAFNNKYQFINKLNFRNTDNLIQLQLIHNKTLINSQTNQKILHFGGLYDCSTTGKNTFMKNGSRLYYSLDEHTLLEYTDGV